MRPHDTALDQTSRYEVRARCLINEIDLSGTLGYEPFVSATWTADADQLATQGQVVLHLDSTNADLRNPAFDYAPRGGLPFRLQVAVSAPGPSTTSWHDVWDGLIDRHVYDREGLTMTLYCRDKMGYLLRHMIEPHTDLHGFTVPAGTLETSSRYVMDHSLIGTGESYNLYAFGDPEWSVIAFWQDALMSTAQAIQRLVDQRGWAFHYRYDNSSNGFFAIYDPDNAAPYPTTGPSPGSSPVDLSNGQIISMTPGLDTANVRNRINLIWGADRDSLLYTVGDSSDLYGWLFMQLSEDRTSEIDTIEEASRMVGQIGDQLAYPLLDIDVERLFWWPVQLGDRFTVPRPEWLIGRDRIAQLSTTYELIVRGYTHTINAKQMRTRINGGLVGVAARRRWLNQPPRRVHISLTEPVGTAPEGTIWIQTDDLTIPGA